MPILIDEDEYSITISNGLSELYFSDGIIEVKYEGQYEGNRMRLSKEQTTKLFSKMRDYYESK